MKNLVDGLHQILTTTISQKRFYFARMLGFRSELELQKYFIRKNIDFLDGGQFLFGKKINTRNRLVYVTVSSDDKSKYTDLYQKIASFPIVEDLYFISYSPNKDWESVDFEVKCDNKKEKIRIPSPDFCYYKFNKNVFIKGNLNDIYNNFEVKAIKSCAQQKENKLDYLMEYSEDIIKNIYSNRFFLDVLLRDYKKGMIDFDGIINREDNLYLLESKEKDPAGQDDSQYFGWDSRRLSWYLYLRIFSGIKTLYVIRQVNNQTERIFVDWKYISLEDFAKSASWLSESGGGGGAGTITVPTSAFGRLDDFIG